MDQMGSRPPGVTKTFFGASLALGSDLELLLSPATELVITGCLIKSTFHCLSQSDREMVSRLLAAPARSCLWVFRPAWEMEGWKPARMALW